jgi:hypothetical protein
MIDIEKELERWKNDNSIGADRIRDLLNELEATRKRVESLELANKCGAQWSEDNSSEGDSFVSYIDELEVTRGALEWQKQIATAALSEAESLRAQLADPRARDIRMMAHDLVLARAALGEGTNLEESVLVAADLYDRLSAIPVPPPKSEVERG